jgi:peroxiredoxin
MRSDIVPGAILPDYELSDHTAKRRKLSELQGQHPMVLVLSRGGFCPKDRRQAEGLVELHRELEVAYCRLVTISTDNITLTNEYRSGVGAHWPFLSDAGRIVQKDLDIAEYTDPVNNPIIPHMIVLEPGLVIYEIYNGYWFFGRLTLEDLRARTYVPLPRNAGRTGTSQRPNSKRRGSKAARNSSLRTAKRTSKLSVNRIRSGIVINYTLRRDRPVPFDLGDDPARPRPASGLIGEICVGTSHVGRRTPDRTRR